MRQIILDTETTGLQPRQGDEIIRIGATRILNGKLLRNEFFEQLVDPRRELPPASTAIHGITPEMLDWVVPGMSGVDICRRVRAERVSHPPYLILITFRGRAADTTAGFAAGAESDLIAYLASRYFGMASYGKIYGMLYMPFGLASAISPVLYGRVRDVTGSYDQMLYAAMFLFAAGAVLLITLGRYPTFDSKEQAA